MSNLIADELIADKESPIAPILQIILTKLWQQQASFDQRKFTITDYQKLKEGGILLKDFYQQQMKKIQDWDQEHGKNVVQSGLALDILAFHTTQWQAAESQTLKKLREQYEHRQDILGDLLTQLDTTYLLAWLSKDKTTLAHDTLAPIIRYNMDISDKPGQKARRILETKTVNYQEDAATIIEPEDLALVENGKDGMRVWTIQEQSLVKKSQAYRDEIEKEWQAQAAYRKKSERNKKRFWAGVLTLSILLAIATSWFAQYRNHQFKISALVAQALAEEKTDPTMAWKTIQKAEVIAPNDPIVLQTRNDIYNNNEFYADNWPLGEAATDLSLVADKRIAIAIGNEVRLLDQNGKSIWTKVQDKEVLLVETSADGSELLIAGKEGIVKVLDVNTGEVINSMRGHKDWVRKAIFLVNNRQVLSGDRNGKLLLWDRKTDTILKTLKDMKPKYGIWLIHLPTTNLYL